jgi:hypothetical protein
MDVEIAFARRSKADRVQNVLEMEPTGIEPMTHC